MSNSSLNIDPRIVPLVRSLKEQPVKSNIPLFKINEDISSNKTLDNSPKIDSKNEESTIVINNKAKDNIKKSNSSNRIDINKNNNRHITMIKSSSKVSINAEPVLKIKSGASEKYKVNNSNSKVIKISKSKEQLINAPNKFQLNSGQFKQKKLNNIKTKTKYIKNLLNDMSLRKYKQSCIDILKNDSVVTKLYEKCGFEKTNYNYENFIQNNFFNKALFMYKLEMLFLDETNFTKKNFKENFFKNEIIKYMNKYLEENNYINQMNSLNDIFKKGFESIINFDLFHD